MIDFLKWFAQVCAFIAVVTAVVFYGFEQLPESAPAPSIDNVHCRDRENCHLQTFIVGTESTRRARCAFWTDENGDRNYCVIDRE